MKMTISGILQLVTLTPYLFLAEYCFFFRNNIRLGLVFVGLEVFLVIFLLLKRRIHYDTHEEKITADAARTAFLWVFNLWFLYLVFMDTAYWYIFFFLSLTPFAFFFIWAKYTGRWKVALRVRL